MLEITQTGTFARWLASLRDPRARIAIARRIERLGTGPAGDTKFLRSGLHELRVDAGPGYRVHKVIRALGVRLHADVAQAERRVMGCLCRSADEFGSIARYDRASRLRELLR